MVLSIPIKKGIGRGSSYDRALEDFYNNINTSKEDVHILRHTIQID